MGWTLGRRTYWAGLEAIRPSMWAEAVEAADGGQPSVDGGCRQAATLHGSDVELDLGSACRQDGECLVGSPLEDARRSYRYVSRVRPW